ncbi:putative ribonuclease H-like domain-containing protein [Tanacetum coccineum]
MDVKSAFLYGKTEEEVYVCQPPGFEDPNFPDIVYKVEKALYELHQAPRAWYETLSTYLLDNEFQRGKIDKTLIHQKLMHEKFQMSSMGELTFFLGLQVQQKKDGIFISQDKYVGEILKKFRFTKVKTTSTPIETQKPLLKDKDGEEVDVHMYRSMIGSLMYLTSSRLNIMFVVCVCARYQVNPKVSHLYAMKRIFRYLKGQPKLGLWYLKDSLFDLVACTRISAYAVGKRLGYKSTTKVSFLGCRLISWQCNKQTVVANSITKAESMWLLFKLLWTKCIGTIIRINYMSMVVGDGEGGIEMEKKVIQEGQNSHMTRIYALTINPTIYISCIEQFWSNVKAKTVNKEVQLHALVDGKKIIITESTMRRDLQQEDAKGVDFLPNSTIFEQLTLMGYEKISQKLTFYKTFFSPQWKFLIHTILQVFLDKQLEGMPTQNRIYIAPSNTKKIFRNMRRVGKGFSGRETPLFQTMVVQDQAEMGEGSANPTDPHHTPTFIQPSTSQPQKKQKPRKPKRKDTQIVDPT